MDDTATVCAMRTVAPARTSQQQPGWRCTKALRLARMPTGRSKSTSWQHRGRARVGQDWRLVPLLIGWPGACFEAAPGSNVAILSLPDGITLTTDSATP